MKIEDSRVELDACHSYSYRCESISRTRFSFGSALADAERALPAGNAAADTAVATGAAGAAAGASNSDGEKLEKLRALLQQLVATLLAMLSGENCRCPPADIADPKPVLPSADATLSAPSGNGERRREMGWQRQVSERIEEHERTTVSSSGTVSTADGRRIAFTLDLAMCRDFSCTRESVESGRVVFKDPLVLSFDGRAAELSGKRFSFDLDADGEAESLPMLAGGSGYLAFDANGDGRIADGSELFGTRSGDGFADLARLDADSNGWVDEADPAWSALGVWFPGGELKPLQAAGVGALHVGSAWSPFALKDENNATLGQVWRSGVYLTDDGRAGALQQIDLGTLKAEAPAAAPAGTGATIAIVAPAVPVNT